MPLKSGFLRLIQFIFPITVLGEKEEKGEEVFKRKGDSPVLLGRCWGEVFWQVCQAQRASHLACNEPDLDTGQAEHVVAGQADGVPRVSQADGARLNVNPGVQEGRAAVKLHAPRAQGRLRTGLGHGSHLERVLLARSLHVRRVTITAAKGL